MSKSKQNEMPIKVAMLGGISEIGKNISIIEYGDDMIVIDCGLGFPDDDMLGIDLVIPDFTYLEKNVDKIRGLFITHGHEDHIGAIPYLLKQINIPIYGTKLSLGIIENKLQEHKLPFKPKLKVVEPGDVIKAGELSVEFITVNHSIADACCLAIKTPLGYILHSGDFKVDYTPVSGGVIDLHRLAQIGQKGVLLLMCESTNVDRPGYTLSEKAVANTLDNIFMHNQNKRIVIATFSSNVHRVQQIINSSVQYGRKIAISGRSMANILAASIRLGYTKVPDGAIIDISEIKRFPPEKITIITTGSQGEPMSALYRMAYNEHDKVMLNSSDLVVISASPIPGNEKLVDKIINELYKHGVSVYRDSTSEIHASGHACREELKLMHTLIKPKYFMPIHGEYKHLVSHKELAVSLGMSPENIFITPDIGKVLEITAKGAKFNGTVPAGKVMIDGYGVGDVGNIVLRDRKHLAEDGLIAVVAVVSTSEFSLISGPDIVSRGFVYVRESEKLMAESRAIAYNAINDCLTSGICEWNHIKNKVKDELSKFLYTKTKRRPMILPVIMDI